ncbi:MAG: hypothetical protein HY791_38950 [Deltaproteobacteria bacterium]|nr:hypothetical protein [Deltaproteobacteria bacterium]
MTLPEFERPLLSRLTDRSGSFSAIWHRIGNDLRQLRRLARLQLDELESRPLRHVVECDFKWDLRGPNPFLYVHHGPTGMEQLSTTIATRLGCAEFGRLLATLGPTPIDLVIEVKAGWGPRSEALERMGQLVRDAKFESRAIVASTSPRILEEVREVIPLLPRALFVLYVRSDGRVVHFPVTDLWRTLKAAGMSAPESLGMADLIIGAGLQPPWMQLERGARLAARGRPFIPGRASDPQALASYASRGAAAAFAYFDPESLSDWP